MKKFIPIIGITALTLGATLAASNFTREAKAVKAVDSSDYYVSYVEAGEYSGDLSNLLDGRFSTGVTFPSTGYLEIKRIDGASFLPKSVKLVFSKTSGIISTGRIRQYVPDVGPFDYYVWELDNVETDDFKIVTANFQYDKTVDFTRSHTPVSVGNLQLMIDHAGSLQEIIINEDIDEGLVSYDADLDAIAPLQEANDMDYVFNGIASVFDGDEKTGIRFHKVNSKEAYFTVDLHTAAEIKDVTLSVPTGSKASANLGSGDVVIKYSNDNIDFTEVALNDSNNSLERWSLGKELPENEIRRYFLLDTPTTARYWKIVLGSQVTEWCSISEIQFNVLKEHPHIEAYGSDESTIIPIAETGDPTGNYGFMIDSDPSTFAWFAGNLNYINFNYSEDITAYGFIVMIGNHNNGDYFSGKVEYYDGDDWVALGEFPYSTESKTVMFASPVTASQFRIASTNGSGEHSPVGTWAAVKEFRLLQDTYLTGSWTPAYQNIYQNISHITDGDFSTSAWFDFKISKDASLVLDLKENTLVEDILLFQQGKTASARDTKPTSANTDYLHNYRIEYFNGSNWVSLGEFVDTVENILVLSSPVTTRYVRVVNLDDSFDGTSYYGAVIREFSVNSLTNYISSFDANVVCDNGVNAPSVGGWELSRNVFRELDPEIQQYVKDYEIDSEALGLLLEKYEYIVMKYTGVVYEEYIGRSALVAYRSSGVGAAIDSSIKIDSALMVALSSLAIFAAVGVLYKIKTKHRQ